MKALVWDWPLQKSLLKCMAGKIDIESEIDQGTIVTMYLPYDASNSLD